MIQFTEEEVNHLRKKGDHCPEAVERIKRGISWIMEEPVQVPKTGIANWSLYYYCPKCSVQLKFNRHDGCHHSCPSCKTVFSGEPYDSTWWGIINTNNYTAACDLGLLYIITGEEGYARKAVAIMLEYAKYYRGYEIHGNIPYNGPGKAGAQTLDEANFLRSFAIAYDLLSDWMSREERDAVRDELLLAGGEFLIKHRHNQLHNHEVIINSAIAIIGLIFGVERYVQFAVYEPYGILYQLENGMLNNHMWFEGAFGYHFYALNSFFVFEKFALHTPHSHIKHPNYRDMMELLVSYLEPGFHIPMLNDTNFGHIASSFQLYEFAYREIGGDKLLYVLNQLYSREKRDNQEAFIYGVDQLPECSCDFPNYHVESGQCGSTVLRGADDRYLLFKHDSYGGEHDHYDRLAISYLAYGKRIAPDLGTTGYGAMMHYDYYKNTGSHNTIVIGEENQAPVNGILRRYEERNGAIFVEAEADWTVPCRMPDSFTIVQWKEENYRTVRMRRAIVWTNDYFVDTVTVTGADPTVPIDWVMHFSGEMISGPKGKPMKVFSEKKPYKHIHDVRQTKMSGVSIPVITVYKDEGIVTQVYGAGMGQTLFCGLGPDNPSVSDINYRIERACGEQAVFVHVITSSDGKSKVKGVSFSEKDARLIVRVTGADGCERVFDCLPGESNFQ